jgi:hypothetical protein
LLNRAFYNPDGARIYFRLLALLQMLKRYTARPNEARRKPSVDIDPAFVSKLSGFNLKVTRPPMGQGGVVIVSIEEKRGPARHRFEIAKILSAVVIDWKYFYEATAHAALLVKRQKLAAVRPFSHWRLPISYG